jgi:hypothetical protein
VTGCALCSYVFLALFSHAGKVTGLKLASHFEFSENALPLRYTVTPRAFEIPFPLLDQHFQLVIVSRLPSIPQNIHRCRTDVSGRDRTMLVKERSDNL